jgi:Mrp family chromosome partitioning ATPase
LYDLIIIDTAPLLATNDAVDLLDLVDDVVLVMRAGKTTMHAADRAVEVLDRRRAHVLGVALTDVDARHSADYYYYGGYYDDSSKTPGRFARWRRGADIDLDEAAVDLDEAADLTTSVTIGN